MKLLCEDRTIRLLLQSLLLDSKTVAWFKDVNDLIDDFNNDIQKQFPRMKLL
jgi:hypothetical protein